MPKSQRPEKDNLHAVVMPEGCVAITVPLHPPRDNMDAIRPFHADVQLNHEQGCTLRRLFDTLDETGDRLKNGRRVANNADAIRWLLERIHAANGSTKK